MLRLSAAFRGKGGGDSNDRRQKRRGKERFSLKRAICAEAANLTSLFNLGLRNAVIPRLTQRAEGLHNRRSVFEEPTSLPRVA